MYGVIGTCLHFSPPEAHYLPELKKTIETDTQIFLNFLYYVRDICRQK